MSDQFAEWLKREMPAGTVISDPEWWAPRILKAARAAPAEPVAWVSQCRTSGLIEQCEPNEKVSNPAYWTDAFPVYTAPDALQAEVERLKDCFSEASKALAGMTDLYNKAQDNADALNAENRRLREEVERLNKALEVAERSVENEVKRRNQYAQESDELDRQIEALTNSNKACEDCFIEMRAERDALKSDLKHWKHCYELLLKQHMPLEPNPDLPGWNRVVDADRLAVEREALQAEVERLSFELSVSKTDELNAAVWAKTEVIRHELWDSQRDNQRLREEVERLKAEKGEQEVLTEHNGCGHGVQVDQLTVRMYRGDKVVMIRGAIGKAYTAKSEVKS